MSAFGELFLMSGILFEDQFADNVTYEPRRGVINGPSELDPSRAGGIVRVVLLKPGIVLGAASGLGQMHARSSADISIWYRALGLLTDVRQTDRFLFEAVDGQPPPPLRFEVADGPIIVGFDWWKAEVIEIPSAVTESPAPVEGDLLRNAEPIAPWDGT